MQTGLPWGNIGEWRSEENAAFGVWSRPWLCVAGDEVLVVSRGASQPKHHRRLTQLLTLEISQPSLSSPPSHLRWAGRVPLAVVYAHVNTPAQSRHRHVVQFSGPVADVRHVLSASLYYVQSSVRSACRKSYRANRGGRALESLGPRS